MKNIIWLASYPKSGNTWFRLFLSALLKEGDLDINKIDEGRVYSRRNVLEDYLEIDSSVLTNNEVYNLLPKVYRFISNEKEELQFYKIHNALTYTYENQLILPSDVTKIAIYFVRNPLDVCISYANHNSETIENTIKDLGNESYSIGTEGAYQFEQELLSWSKHVESWKNNSLFPVHIVRYEDMVNDTFSEFKRILNLCGVNFNDNQIKNAIDETSFEKLKKQEEEKGFREKTFNSPRFFNNGKSGTWKGVLTEKQIDKIISDHRLVMKKLGYL